MQRKHAMIVATAVMCVASMAYGAEAIPRTAAYFRSRPVKCEVDSGVFARDAARDHDAVDRIVNGEIEVVGVGWSFPSNRVDWLFDASAKKGPYNPEWTWQLNRMSFWTALARAYARTGDEKYARAFAQQFSDWQKQTGGIPPERDYNVRGSPWRTIEEGIRLMGSWSVAFEAFRKSPAFTDDLLLAFVNSAHAQARHLIAHRTRGNWLLMEMTGAYFFALDFPEFEDSESIRLEALRVFSQAIKEQVLPDGLHYELSPNYHQVFHSSLTRLFLRAKAFGLEHEVPKDFLDTLRLGTEGPLALVTPAFTQPNFNDTFTDPKASSLSAAAKLFPDRRDFLWLVTNGRKGEPPKGETASRYLPYSGFAAMRTDWSPNATYLAFDVGPLGMGHWHQDKLSFVLWKGNECLVFDDGGGQYESSRRRNYGRSGYDHNTMLVDGLAQNRTGPKISSAPIDAGWRSTQDEDFAFGIYDQEFGPKRLKLATQRREITFDKKRDVFTICDVAESADGKEHDYTLLFQLDTTNVVVSADGRRVRADYGAGKKYALEMEFPGDGGERAEAVTGRLKPSMAGWFVGREYLVPMVRPATTVFVKAPRAKAHRFKTVLRPTRASSDMHSADRQAVRAARSVHLWYVPPIREKATGVQATVTVRDTVPGTYFCAACFNMGYCGFQELYDGSRVFIFSVWDPGDPFDSSANPNAVKEERRVKCLFSKEGVRIKRFGGEGTGGQAMAPYPWKTGEPETVWITAAPDGTNRVAFTAWVKKHGTDDEWERMATFSTLHGGKGAHIQYAAAFIEDFRRDFKSVKKMRRADFTDVCFFIGSGAKRPVAVTKGVFSSENSPSRAISAEPIPGGWTLSTGGDTPDRTSLLDKPMAAAPRGSRPPHAK